ncbi:hypothetical protein GY45DRAFT_534501 [Cubamyces sp. BRFM 1775]|nr:hypothetical protein GY45DRAFT_534501 [Cubamyces sp. BRFM 1775]
MLHRLTKHRKTKYKPPTNIRIAHLLQLSLEPYTGRFTIPLLTYVSHSGIWHFS